MNTNGYTLVELLPVIVIMGMLAAIAIPIYGYFMEEYKEDLCEGNRVEMARMNEDFLFIEELEHSSVAFDTWLDGR